MKRAIIVHRWDGNPNSDWYKWLKNQLEKRGFNAKILEMPDAKHPKIDLWVPHLLNKAKDADENTYFIGHSVGCQAIIRYLERINKKVGGAIFVGGWFVLKDEDTQSKEEREISEPWLKNKIDFDKVKKTTKNFTAIFSKDDPYVPLENAKIFKEKLNAKIIIQDKKGHYMESDGVTELQIVLDELIKMTK